MTNWLLRSSALYDAGVLTKIPNPDLRKVGTTLCFVRRDHLASVKMETDASGAIAMRQRFTAFGSKIPVSSLSCGNESRGFVGQRHDGDTRSARSVTATARRPTTASTRPATG